jgi:hypothetical protein
LITVQGGKHETLMNDQKTSDDLLTQAFAAIGINVI